MLFSSERDEDVCDGSGLGHVESGILIVAVRDNPDVDNDGDDSEEGAVTAGLAFFPGRGLKRGLVHSGFTGMTTLFSIASARLVFFHDTLALGS